MPDEYVEAYRDQQTWVNEEQPRNANRPLKSQQRILPRILRKLLPLAEGSQISE